MPSYQRGSCENEFLDMKPWTFNRFNKTDSTTFESPLTSLLTCKITGVTIAGITAEHADVSGLGSDQSWTRLRLFFNDLDSTRTWALRTPDWALSLVARQHGPAARQANTFLTFDQSSIINATFSTWPQHLKSFHVWSQNVEPRQQRLQLDCSGPVNAPLPMCIFSCMWTC